jgi:hypothetical protein
MPFVKVLVFHLPLIVMLLILGFFELVDAGRLGAVRSESTFGWMVVFWYPLSAVLGLTQVVLWIRWIVRHGISSWNMKRNKRRTVFAGLIILGAALLLLIALRVAQRWGLSG